MKETAVSSVFYKGGVFEKLPDGTWQERSTDNNKILGKFSQQGKLPTSTFLQDLASSKTIELNEGEKSIYTDWEKERKILYAITAFKYEDADVVFPADLTPQDYAAIMKWIGQVASAAKTDYCWKQSLGRGVGVPLSTCPPDKDKDGALCYPRV